MKMNIIINSTKEERLKIEEMRKNAKPSSLAILRPDLLAEWDWVKNNEANLNPYQLTVGSGKKAWWTCPNHEESYYAQIYKRTKDGTGCPYCDGKKVLKGFNDLASQYPHLLKEWDYERNTVSPDEVMCGTNKKAHWICERHKHRWYASVHKRTKLGHNCPICKKEAMTKRIIESAQKRKKSHEQFVSEAKKANKHVVVVGQYKDAKTRVEVECVYCGERYKTHPGNVLSGTKHRDCSAKDRCIDIESFKKRLSEVHDDIELIGGYVKASEKAEFKCKVCGNTWSALGTSVLRGSGCSNPECISRKISQANTKSHEQFAAELAEKKPHIKLLGKYVNTKTPILVKCTKCGHEWPANPGHLLYDTDCPKCAHNVQLTHKEFVSRVNEINPEIEVLGHYINNKSRIAVRCKVCGHRWKPAAGSLLSGTGCSSCAGNQKKTNEQFLEELSNINPNIEPLEKYNGANNVIEFHCKVCDNKWGSTPHRILSGGGCPECNTAIHSFFEHALLYALRQSLGEDKVLSRYRRAIGFELDVYIPSLNIAFEPGEWFYHKNVVDRDLDKFIFSSTARIDLTIIYCGYDKEEKPSFDCITTKSHLTVREWDDVVAMIKLLMDKYSISYENVDWNKVKRDAMKYCGRRTTKKFIEELSAIQPDIEVLGEYVGARSRIKVRCKKCGHRWSPIADSLLRGHGCKKCRDKANGDRSRKNKEQFVKELAAINKDIEVIGEYKGWDHKVHVKCRLCDNEWDIMAGYLLKGSKCQKCFKSGKKTHDEFIEELSKKNPTVTVLSEYVTGKDKVEAKCNTCGYTWGVMPESLLAGKSCPLCGIGKSAEKHRKTHEKFVAQLAEKNPKVIAIGKYHYAREKMKFKCVDCGHEWDATPDNILRGRGCSKCKYKKAAETRKKNKAKATLAQEDTSQ